MKEKNEVTFLKAPVISYSHHAFPLGLIMSSTDSIEWFISNYIYLYWKQGINSFNFLVEYDNNPYLDMRSVYHDELAHLLQFMTLEQWICTQINQDKAVEIIVDYYYLPGSLEYQKKHFMHEILITSYNLKEGIFVYWDYINNSFMQYQCAFADVVPFNSDILYGDGVISKLLKKKKSQFHYNQDILWKQLYDYFHSLNPYDEIAIWGDYSQYSHNIFGIKCYDKLLNHLQSESKNGMIDYRYLNVLFEHKKCMRIRFEYIESIGKGQDFFINDKLMQDVMKLEESAKTILLLGLKYNICTDFVEKEKIFRRILDKVAKVKEQESEILKKLLIKKGYTV